MAGIKQLNGSSESRAAQVHLPPEVSPSLTGIGKLLMALTLVLYRDSPKVEPAAPDLP